MSKTKFLANKNVKYYPHDPRIGKSIRIRSNAPFKYVFLDGNPNYDSDDTVRITGILKDNFGGGDMKTYYLFNAAPSPNIMTAVIETKYATVLENGGVLNSPLAHLYRSLRALFNRKVVAYD